MRVYASKKVDLLELPNNPKSTTLDFSNQGDFNGVCPKIASVRSYKVTATTARKALPGGTLVYNPRTNNGGNFTIRRRSCSSARKISIHSQA